jgi:hypothetical protein
MRPKFANVLAGLLALAVLPSMGAAQTTDHRPPAEEPSASLVPGTRVRISYRHERPWAGVVVARNADTLIVRTASGSDTNVVPLAQVTRLEIGRPGQRHELRNTVIGLAVGTGVGAVIGGMASSGGCTRYDPCWLDITGTRPEPPRRDRTAVGAVLGGAAGAVLGYLAGHRPAEKWQRLSSGVQQMRVSASPRNGGSLAVALAF